MKILTEKRVEIGGPEDPGIICLREPTNEEWNEYNSTLFTPDGGQVKDTSGNANDKLFDKLVTKIENVQVGDVEVTLNNLGILPQRYKTQIITRIFLSGVPVTEKNLSRDSIASSDDSESPDAASAES